MLESVFYMLRCEAVKRTSLSWIATSIPETSVIETSEREYVKESERESVCGCGCGCARRKKRKYLLTIRKLLQRFRKVLKPPHNIAQARRRPEVLLFEAEFFPDYMYICMYMKLKRN